MKKSISLRALHKDEKTASRKGVARLSQRYDHDRPRTRGDCKDGPRPCPWLGCRYHLFLNPEPSGGIHFPYGMDDEALHKMPFTCALDVADTGPKPLHFLATLYHQSRQNYDQITMRALERLRHASNGDGGTAVSKAFTRLRAAYEDT